MRPPKRLFRNRPPLPSGGAQDRDFQGSRFSVIRRGDPHPEISGALSVLERSGFILIVPGIQTRHGARIIILLRNPKLKGWVVPWYDPAWIAAKESELGTEPGWLAAHIDESIAFGWLPPRKDGEP